MSEIPLNLSFIYKFFSNDGLKEFIRFLDSNREPIVQNVISMEGQKNGIPVDDVEWVNLNADEAVGPMMSGDLSAAYMYEPWITNVVENRPGTTSVINTADPDMLKTGIFMDVMYMNTNFIKSRRKVALDMLKARWDAVQYWHDNTDEVNKLFAEYLKWPAEDIGYVIGNFFTLLFSTNFEDLISIRIAIGSGTAFMVAQLLDVQIFDKLRQKKWFIAPLASSFVGSIVDTFLFFSISFYGTGVPWVTLSLGDLAVKILVALIMLVPFRMMLGILKPA